MAHYTRLTSEKYLIEHRKQELAQEKARARKEAAQSFFNLILAVSLFAVGFWACFQYPQVTEYLTCWF